MLILIKVLHFLIRLIPAKILLKLVYNILTLKGYRKQVINKNYISTIGSNFSNLTFDEFYRKCIQNIARVIVETVKFSKKNTSSQSYKDINQLEVYCKQNNGLILMASHYGNWELACTNLPLHTDLPCYGVYKPLKNKTLDKELIKLRSTHGLQLVPMNSIARSIAKNHNSKTPAFYILIADQNPRSIQNVIWVEFLGIKTAFSNGVTKLQNKYNLSVAYMKVNPHTDVYEYDIEFEYPNEIDKKNYVTWYSHCVERQISIAPQYWLWSHKRWKRKYESAN